MGLVHRVEKFHTSLREGWQLWSDPMILAFTAAVSAQVICYSCDVTPTPNLHFHCWNDFCRTLSTPACPSLSSWAQNQFLLSPHKSYTWVWKKKCIHPRHAVLSRTVDCSAWLLCMYLDSMSHTNLQNSHLWKYLKKPWQPNRYDMWETACPSLPLKQTRLQGIWLFLDKPFRAVI